MAAEKLERRWIGMDNSPLAISVIQDRIAGLQQRNNYARIFTTNVMVEEMARKDPSPTFRKGNSGEWREHFTPKVKAAFKAQGGGDWLQQYGYEAAKDW